MRFGIIGLGRMGRSLAVKALEAGHEPVGWDPSEEARTDTQGGGGVETADTLEELVQSLDPPRFLLMYVPQGAPVEANVATLRELLSDGDVLGDGGNSHWEPSETHRSRLDEVGVRYLDVGTSGGIAEASGWEGAAFMVSGDRDAYEWVEPLLQDLAVSDGAVHYVGEGSSGHFAKLVHNAIEFGMIQAIAEGVELLARSDYEIDLAALFAHWNHGTVIRSWLVELMANALEEGPIGDAADPEADFARLSTYVEDTGEVKWVLSWALEKDIPTPAVSTAQQALMGYRNVNSPAAKAVALLRNQFGGHPVHVEERDE